MEHLKVFLEYVKTVLIVNTITCNIDSIIGYVIGPLLCIGSVCTYIPQYYLIVKSKSVDGINEFSWLILNVGNFCLSLNSIILNWDKWSCFGKCNVWLCMAHLLPFYQILIGWVMVFIFYMLFMKYKIKNRENKLIGVLFYCLLYIGFILIVVVISVGEKVGNTGPSKYIFFEIFAQFLGYTSAVCNAAALLPQIYTLLKTRRFENLSPVMYGLQIPGNIITIIFQAVLFSQPVSTWITYVISCIEQTVVFVLIIYFSCKDDYESNSTLEDEEIDEFV